ncbi:pyridine nucleotide-disulfide oxidoreductase family protein [Ligilactobacillus hayakitensis DSM 18933 = JCM 14209]|uniref:Pyridine nucleotide-disulfide oxidoreductase family protein n=1 Tax=Ligilactobacillus hayakitensis DSM 18933 = JCM 14209 TaxID=1423755 RepID=A0A0R1WNW4_9LACO|nr:FAD-containing oxidoreductase [Ligilactobacillus hayakitensis]KRM17401.1 pyridine nucleotide-disulfide oxidoreductase family protein [Ligilactobacillus hayakitensis DSM 18933 = JCM 14209]
MEKFKNVIIGFGKGGKTLAKKLSSMGESVLVIEKSKKMYGGTCINIACLPSKNLILNAERGVEFTEAINTKNELTSFLRNKNYHMVADEATAQVLDGNAKFISNDVIEITLENGEKVQVTGERIFINTGATPVIPNIEGIKESQNILDSTAAMDLANLPKDLAIIGGGYIGLEFSEMFRKYGSNVTVLDINTTFLPREDDDVAQMIFSDLKDEGITFELGAQVQKITDVDGKSVIIFEQDGRTKEVKVDKILVASGRKPATTNLGLENTDIKVDDRGAVVIDDQLKTSVDNVWAIGDVKGGLQFTYISLDDFRIIMNQLYGDNSRRVSDRTIVPYSVFINPPLSNVGLNEKQAKAQGKSYKLYKQLVAAVPKARVIGDTRGIYKVLVDETTNEILGATIYGEESHEVINLITLAMKAKLPYTMLRDQIYTHPTMAEALNDVLK